MPVHTLDIPRTSRGSRKAARLIVVDDHELARAGVRRLLHGALDVEVIAEAATFHDALTLCRSLTPDLVLMDVRLADMDGLRATQMIRESVPQTRVLLFTLYEVDEYVAEAGRAGASGYVLKGASRSELLEAIRAALAS